MKYTSNREINKLLEQVVEAGGEVSYCGSGHWKAKMPGIDAVFLPSTPGKTNRSVENAAAKVKRIIRQAQKKPATEAGQRVAG